MKNILAENMRRFNTKNLSEAEYNNKLDSSEKEKIENLVTNYVNLRKAVDDPNYPDTSHTIATMLKLGKNLNQMSRKESYKFAILKILPPEYNDIID